jgi:hypothetical protein
MDDNQVLKEIATSFINPFTRKGRLTVIFVLQIGIYMPSDPSLFGKSDSGRSSQFD